MPPLRLWWSSCQTFGMGEKTANKVLDLGKSLFRGILMLVCLVSFLSIQLLCAFWFSVSCFTFASGVGLNIFGQYFWTFVCCTFIVQIWVCLYKSIKPNNSLWLDFKLYYFIDILHKKNLNRTFRNTDTLLHVTVHFLHCILSNWINVYLVVNVKILREL